MFHVKADNIAKRYAGRTVIRSLSMEAQAGEIICLTGPNGSGKTTLLKMLCGLLRPTKGAVVITQRGASAPAAAVRRSLGIQTPHVRLYEELTARENIDFLLRVRGLAPDPGKAPAALEKLEIAAAADRPFGDLSSGMKQRVLLAASLAHDPPALFLDEPTSFLDQPGRDCVTAAIQDLKKSKLVIVATNDPRERDWGDRIIELGL
jgi:ABC-type multidrug transport system ATPase subunit